MSQHIAPRDCVLRDIRRCQTTSIFVSMNGYGDESNYYWTGKSRHHLWYLEASLLHEDTVLISGFPCKSVSVFEHMCRVTCHKRLWLHQTLPTYKMVRLSARASVATQKVAAITCNRHRISTGIQPSVFHMLSCLLRHPKRRSFFNSKHTAKIRFEYHWQLSQRPNSFLLSLGVSRLFTAVVQTIWRVDVESTARYVLVLYPTSMRTNR